MPLKDKLYANGDAYVVWDKGAQFQTKIRISRRRRAADGCVRKKRPVGANVVNRKKLDVSQQTGR